MAVFDEFCHEAGHEVENARGRVAARRDLNRVHVDDTALALDDAGDLRLWPALPTCRGNSRRGASSPLPYGDSISHARSVVALPNTPLTMRPHQTMLSCFVNTSPLRCACRCRRLPPTWAWMWSSTDSGSAATAGRSSPNRREGAILLPVLAAWVRSLRSMVVQIVYRTEDNHGRDVPTSATCGTMSCGEIASQFHTNHQRAIISCKDLGHERTIVAEQGTPLPRCAGPAALLTDGAYRRE